MPKTWHLGKNPIDNIMCITNVFIKKVAYLPFGVGVDDHRPLVVQTDEISVCGQVGAPSSKLRARKLKLNDPHIMDKYKELLDVFYVKHKLCKKVYEMNKIPVQYPLQRGLANKYEEIDRI